MHEAAFSQAALPAPARVLGLWLRPYSLGHELWLIREQSAFVSEQPALRVQYADLPAAVMVCCHRFSQIEALDRDFLFSLKCRLWKFRIRKMNLHEELAKFLIYRSRGSLELPDEPASSSGPQRTPGAPFLLRLHDFVMSRIGLTELAAWDYPFGLAKIRYAAWLESQGALNVKNEYDTAFDREFEAWEKNQTGPGLRKEAPDA